MRYKKTVLAVTVVLILSAAAAYAQPYFGARVPIGYVTADVETLDENRFTTGIEGIGGLKLGTFAIEGKIGYMAHVYTTEILGEEVSASLNYTRFAVLAKLYSASILYLGAGIEFSYLVGYTVATENQSYTQNIEEQEGPIFLALDAGIELPFGRNLYLPVGAFFNYAIGNIPDDTSLLELGVKAGIQYRY
jgi:hypothetical protein